MLPAKPTNADLGYANFLHPGFLPNIPFACNTCRNAVAIVLRSPMCGSDGSSGRPGHTRHYPSLALVAFRHMIATTTQVTSTMQKPTT
jgi:hypothetical protein